MKSPNRKTRSKRKVTRKKTTKAQKNTRVTRKRKKNISFAFIPFLKDSKTIGYVLKSVEGVGAVSLSRLNGFVRKFDEDGFVDSSYFSDKPPEFDESEEPDDEPDGSD